MGDQVKTYITADTIISSLGFSTQENMDHIRNYHSGIQSIHDKGLYEFPFMGALIDYNRLQEEITLQRLENYSRMEQLFILSIKEVIRKSNVDTTNPDCALILSTTKGNIHASLPDMGKLIGGYFRLASPPIIISTACISGVSALIVASRLIQEGKYRHAIVAGGDVLTRFIVSGFHSFKSISPERCKPYDKSRDGLSLGEACGAVLVTSDTGLVHDKQPILIEGGAISNDANHISGPSRTGDGLFHAISQSMAENGLCPDDISFVNAHGTATVYNDEMESKAFHLAGLDKLPLNSLKTYWGHTLGASGIIESIACMEGLRSGELFGICGFESSDVTYPLQISAHHRLLDMKRCVKTASGFGGCNASVVLALEEYAKPPLKKSPSQTNITHSCTIENGKVIKNGIPVFKSTSGKDFSSFIRDAYKNLGIDDRKFYKMDNLCKLGYITAAYLLSDINLSSIYKPEEIGIILSNHSASLDTDIKHQHILDTLGDQEASPAIFVYTLPNVVAGEICIRHNIKGENTFFISRQYDETFMSQYAESAMKRQKLCACIIGWCELLGESYKSNMQLIR